MDSPGNLISNGDGSSITVIIVVTAIMVVVVVVIMIVIVVVVVAIVFTRITFMVFKVTDVSIAGVIILHSCYFGLPLNGGRKSYCGRQGLHKQDRKEDCVLGHLGGLSNKRPNEEDLKASFPDGASIRCERPDKNRWRVAEKVAGIAEQVLG